MIFLGTEKLIRKLLGLGLPDRDIAQRTGISHGTVGTIRQMCDLVDGLPRKQKKDIVNLLKAGLSVGSIEMRLRIPKGTILAVRRYYFLYGCKGENLRLPSQLVNTPSPIRHVPCEDKLISVIWGLYQIVCDTADLDELAVITSPPFHHIALRAKELLKEIGVSRNG